MKLVHNGNNRRQLGFMLETYAPARTPGVVKHQGKRWAPCWKAPCC